MYVICVRDSPSVCSSVAPLDGPEAHPALIRSKPYYDGSKPIPASFEALPGVSETCLGWYGPVLHLCLRPLQLALRPLRLALGPLQLALGPLGLALRPIWLGSRPLRLLPDPSNHKMIDANELIF